MALGAAIVLIACGLACGAAAVRNRDRFWAVLGAAIFAITGYRFLTSGVDTSHVVGDTDSLLMMLGGTLVGAILLLATSLPKPVEDRLVYGSRFAERAFERDVIEARRPFLEAAADHDELMSEKGRWRERLSAIPPNREWASLADRLATGDQQWAAHARAGSSRDEWLPWVARDDQVRAEWEALHDALRAHGEQRARVMSRLWTVALVVSATLFFAGDLNLTNGLLSGPPPGRAGYVPEHPPGRTVHIAPLGGFPPGRLAELVSFYAVRYDLGIHVLPPASIPDGARDYARNQLVGEALIDVLRATYAEAADPNRVIIGVTSEDLYSRSIPEWRWAFGLRRAGQLAVVSTARMEPEPGPFGDRLEAARLRKMVTKNIGVLFFGLDTSSDPRNVLFNNILSVDDLDAMSEDF